MPKIGDMIKKSKYIKKDDLEDMGGEADLTIVGVKEMNVARDDQPEDMKWVMKFRELEQLWVLNNVNLQLIEAALGSDDSADWRGKTLTLYVDPNVMMSGKLVGGIRVRVPRPAKPAAPVKAEGAATARVAGGKFDDFESDIPF